ncbi:sensor histidine kinase N-terminal domain-containing protein [Aestuariibius sp. 2305UL40-4]|uniref:sensor histidine kinase N-terminal domain-containing protein n=1 Tax=Aestuariibius violaceus TaxID=3234132 RepID=UPI00345E077F
MRTPSLRVRLLAVILAPLIVISALVGIWRFVDASRTAERLFDRTLLAASFAIAKDVVTTEGEMLSQTTWDTLNDAAGGQIYYHVNGPDGSFVIGYATPPVPPAEIDAQDPGPIFYNSQHLGEDVRVVRLREETDMGWVSGLSTVTTWQRIEARRAFAWDLARRTVVVITILIGSVAFVVWFGVRYGLRPLADLQSAIAMRSPDDLREIARPVPNEVEGIVRTLNSLFSQVERQISSKDAFISDAAHQLRNPVAGVLSLAEAARDAKSEASRRQRIALLVTAARHTSRLTQQLLSYERARYQELGSDDPRIDLAEICRDVAGRNRGSLQPRISLHVMVDGEAWVRGDAAMMGEAIQNLIDNAVTHGKTTTKVTLEVSRNGHQVRLTLSDDGEGLAANDFDKAVERFSQLGDGPGSGLGLSIVKAVCDRHEGVLTLEEVPRGTRISMTFPAVEEVALAAE